MSIIYNLIFLVFALIYLPLYFFRRKFHAGFKMRLGILAHQLELNRPVWIHAVSVGEVIAIRKLIEGLRIAYPDKRFLISTVTPTGNKIARGIAGPADFVSYLPLDLSFIVRGVVDKIQPSLFIIVETEIWPNLIQQLSHKNIPIVLVNGRISDHSFRGYRMIKFLLQPILSKINLFCVQTKLDADRLMHLGVLEERIKITGNMKFDIAQYQSPAADSAPGGQAEILKLRLGLGTQEKLLVCGSTHPQEEEIILDTYKKLLPEFANLRLFIAPRYPERASAVEKIVLKKGFSSLLISHLPASPQAQAQKPVFILDSIGQLLSFYALADIVFVGGSFIKKGGHNILEPASLSKPIIFGPYMFNFRDITRLFLENKAALSVRNKEELEIKIRGLLNNPARISELSQRAQALVLDNRGASARNLEYLTNYL